MTTPLCNATITFEGQSTFRCGLAQGHLTERHEEIGDIAYRLPRRPYTVTWKGDSRAVGEEWNLIAGVGRKRTDR